MTNPNSMKTKAAKRRFQDQLKQLEGEISCFFHKGILHEHNQLMLWDSYHPQKRLGSRNSKAINLQRPILWRGMGRNRI